MRTETAEVRYQRALSDPDVPAEALADLAAAADGAWQAMRVTAGARDAAVTAGARMAADDANVAAWHAWLNAEAALLTG